MKGVARVMLVLGALAVACDAPTTGSDGSFELELAWSPPSGAVGPGVLLAESPRVRVVNSLGSPRANTAVAFTLVRGGGSLGAWWDTTDATGYASVTWQTGNRAGTQEVRAFVPEANDGEYISFEVIVQAGAATAINFLMPGGTFYRTATWPSMLAFRDAAGNVVPAPEAVVYSSADTTIATVAANGAVTGVRRGVTILTASSGGLSDTALVTVRSTVPTVTSSGYAIGVPSMRPVFLPSREMLLPTIDGSTVRRFNAATQVLSPTSITVPTSAREVDVNASGTRAVATSATSNVYLIDVPTNSVIRSIPVAGPTNRVAVSASGDFAYVTYDTPAIARINLATDEVTALALPGTQHNGIALSPDGSTLFVSATTNEVYRISTATMTITNATSLSHTVQGLALTADGTSLYVARAGGSIYRLSGTTLTFTGTTPDYPSGHLDVILSDDEDYIIASGSSGIRIYDATTLAHYADISALNWRRLARDPVTGEIWASSQAGRVLRMVVVP